MSKELIEFESDPYSLFIFALNSPSTKEKCVPRLNKFFEFINLNGTMQEKSLTFVKKIRFCHTMYPSFDLLFSGEVVPIVICNATFYLIGRRTCTPT
jgi:hypothetical protein